MNIELPSDAAKFIEGMIASGEYRSVEEAVADGVRLLMDRKKLRADIQQGIDELNAGQGIAADAVFAELRDRARNLSE